jgi:biopolymer transport protein ExbD
MNLEDEDDAIATINIIPFVDIVLVLLIIFMVTSTAIVRQAFQVDLPKAASAGQGVESTLNLVLDKEGELFLNGETTKREELAAYVREEAEKTEKLQAVIAADTASQYGEIVALIDLVKQNGVQSFALNIERDVDATSAQ